MAKHLLHTVLVKVLGEFIELDEDNLNLAVWSGQIVLNNLKLKTDTILKNFNLNVFHGSIQRLEVTIPWATLLINPVKIVVSGILLDVGPLDIAKLGKLEALKRYMAEKLQKLKMVDQYLELSLNLKGGATGGENSTANNSSNPNSETYIQQWTTKIIDNVEIRVTDLHIRYEDSLSIPGRVFACGVTLHSFGISTCDGNWELSGSRKGNNSDSTPGRVNKLAYLKCLGIYWQVDASSLANMPQVEWERTMMLYIVREDTSSPYGSFGANDGGISAHIAQAVNSSRNAGVVDAKQYILAPYNNTLTVKLTQNKKPTESVPKFDVRAESSNLQIRLDSVQYTELFSVVDRLVSLGRMYKPKTYRPNERPWDRRSCIAWWKYGCKLAVRLRKYVKLVKLSLRLAAGREDPHQYLPPYAAAEARYLEERLPFEPLRMGRQRAMLELHEEMKKQMRLQEKQQQVEEEPARGGGWWGTWSDSRYGSPVKTKNAGAAVRSDEDISIESILAALNAPEGQQGKGKQAQTTDIVVAMFRFSLESSSTAIISNAQQPLIQVNSALTLSFAQTSAGMTFKCSLQDLLVLDRFTKNPPVPYIISVKSDLSYAQRSLQVLDDPTARARPTFSLMFERISGKSKVVIAALPIELCLNKECIQMVLHTFARPENKYATKERTPKASPRRPQPSALTTAAQQGIENLRNVSQRNDDIQIIFEASAPKIVIPESGEDSGYLLLDCGYLEVKGFLGSSGMSMNMSLYQATVGMPLTVRDMYKFGEKSLYLIKPFDIIMYVQNVDQVVAALTVNVEIKPEIRGEIDSLKLARLLTAMGQISGIFAKLPQPTSDIVTATSAPNMRHLLPASAASSALSLQSSTTASASAHFSPRHQRTPVKATQAPTTTTTTTGLQPTGEHPLALDSSLDAAQDSSFGSVKSPDAESLEFHTPDRNSQGSTPRYSDASSGGNIYGNVYGQFEEFTSGGGGDHHKSSISIKRRESEAKAANRSPEQQAAAQQDPTVCSMRIDLVLPAVALDLTYDVHKGYHLVLEVKSLRTTMLSRLHDRSINFEMGAVSMRDSFRAAAQRDLIWTPPESGKLVRVSYVNVTSKESPLYVRHATDIVMKFANLGLNVDVNTINHLRPFFEVLLSSRQPAAPEQDQPASPAAGSSGGTSPHPSQSQSNSAGVSAYASNSSLAGMLMDDDPNTPPSGTSVTASLERISLDFLRASTNEKMGALLETAFSAQISGMRCDLDMKGLMKAEIRLRSFEIIDVRHISGDYVFKKIFCPAFESHEAGSTAPDDVSGDENDAVRDASFEQDPDVSMSSIGYANSLVGLDTGFTSPMTAQSKSPRHKAIDENLLYVVFKQESKVHNHFDIVISNITSFIAIDTILDLTNVALANVFAFFGLLAAPAPKLPDILLAQPKAVGQPPPPTNTADMTGSRSDKMYTPNSSSKKVSGGPVESPSSDSGTPHAAAEKDPGTASILSAVLHIRSPRLIFLEDPSSEESQAIVGTCGVILNYTRETTTRASGVSMYESLHVTLSKYEVYVLKSMMRWYPQPILEPVEVEVHLKKRSVDGVTRMMNAHVELDNVNAQVSFNDILLAQSILSRRILSEAPPAGSNPEPPTPAPPPVAVNTPAAVAEACGEDDPEDGTLPQSSGNVNQPALLPPAEPSVMSFQFGMGTLAMVIINDFNGQSTPIIKTSISNSHFGMESVGPSVSGDGALDAKVDFFNPRLSSWEPILDMWQPTARIYSMNDSKIFEVKSNYTMQLTVSGIILETLLRSYSLFFHELDLLGERTSVAGICVHNQLGEDVVVELYDSASKRKLVALSGNQIGAISNLQDHAGKIWSKALNLPSSVDLHFVGRFQSLRMPLFHLPLNVNKPKAYNLQPIAPRSGENTPDEKDEASSVWTTKAAKVYVIEPIVEEVFENSRYDPIMGCWRKPYFMGDPYEWTDGSGTIRRDIGSIEIASDKWEWQGKWEIDMDGQIGKEIDAQGWEYASSFNFFTMVSLRRCSQAMDGCRRRRWTRTRIPRASSQGLQERPLTLFWDVKSLKDGSRKVDLRSALQFSNQLAFPIIISLQHNAWDREVELGPIGTDEVFSVPLLYSYANAVRFRPDFPLYNWSPYFPCNVHTYDFSTTKSTNCSGQAIDVNAVWFRLVTSQVNKSVLVSVVPFLTITNKLLCDMRFICTDTYQKSESGEIESGREKKLSHINVSSQPILSIKVGNFEWSESIELITSADSASLFELHLPGRKKGNKLYLSMNSKICPTRGLSIEIFSKVAIIDRTSLHLFVASKLRPGVNLVRSTCATLRDSGNSSSNNSGGGNSTTGMVAANRERIDSTASSKVGGVDSESMVSEATVSGLQLKVPSSDSRSTLRRPSRPNLLTDPGAGSGDISPVLSGFANPVRNAFSYRSNFPETATVKVDNTPIVRGRKAGVAVHLRADGLHTGSRAAADVDSLASVQLPAHAPVPTQTLIRDIEVCSRNKYQLILPSASQRVYSDHAMRWGHLPPCFLDQLQLRTPFEDRLQRSTRLVQFTASTDCMLLLLVDINAPLKWLLVDGFIKLREIATARSVTRGNLEETHFAIYGKICHKDQRVVLKSSWNKTTLTMYTLFFLPLIAAVAEGSSTAAVTGASTNSGPGTGSATVTESHHDSDDTAAMRADSLDSVLRQLNYKDVYSRELATRSWTEGSNHLSLMYTYDNIVTVGLCKGKVWSREINIDTRKNAASKGSFEVENAESNISYQLSYGLHALPGLYSETQLIYFMPKYCILNCTEEVLLVSQRGSEKYLQYLSYKPEGWHKLELDSGTDVQFRTASTLWSLGAVDINDIGSSVLYIPFKEHTIAAAESSQPGAPPTQRGIVLHIEVKLADPTDHCSIIVIVWQETIESRAAMSIRNSSDVPITIRQADIEMDHEIQNQEHLFELCVPPGASLPFGWADPESGNDVLVTVGEGIKGQNKRIASINMLKTEQMLRLPYNFGRLNAKGEVVISVSTNNSGHVLEISNLTKRSFLVHDQLDGAGGEQAPEAVEDLEARQRTQGFPTYGFNFVLSSFGISLVVEKPQRREFVSLYVDWLEVLVRMKGNMRSLEFMIMDLQVDNYSETVIYPVLLRSSKKEIRRSVALSGSSNEPDAGRQRQESNLLSSPQKLGEEATSDRDYQRKPDDPFIKLTMVQEVPADGTQAIFKYVACRVLPLVVEVDSATVQLLFTDLLDDLKILTRSQALALSVPDLWLNEFNMRQLYPQQQLRMVNVYRSKIQAQQSKMYFKKLIIHPVKITFTFAQTTFPRRLQRETLQSTVLNVLMSLVGVEKLRLHLRSFEVEDAMESLSTLADMINSKSMQDVRSQLTQIAGSLTMLGSPIGFARRVGSGVKAFFYEPYQGAVHGSGDFFLGLGRGTSTLFSGVVSGAMDSAVAIVGTASKGISHLSGDADYVRKRAIKRQQSKVNRGGILEGMREGGESVISGISAGVTGLVSKPIEEASKTGIHGFFKGLGLGLIGAAVKPVIGLSDGLTSVAQGISNQVDPGLKTSHVRPPRALEPSPIDPSILMVVPLNLEAAFAQEFVFHRAKQNHYDDAFLRYIPLESKGEAIILSSVYVYWRRKASLWGRVWANVSHCVYMTDAVGIMLYSGGKNGGASLVTIPCKSIATAKRVYAALAENTARMGNPSNVIPVDIVMKVGTGTGGGSSLSPSGSREQDLHTLLRDGRRITQSTSEVLRQVVDESQLGALDGYRFGAANGAVLTQITGSEDDILKRATHHLEKEIGTWQRVDQHIWRLLWEWGCIHSNLSACRCSVTVLINRSDSPIQITRVQLLIGRNVLIIGSNATGYETESRSLMPEGMMIVFISAFPESPLDIGHLKANINTAAFSAVLASTQRESFCEAKGGFTVGFLEKTVSDWWSKCGYTVGRTTGESSLNDQLRIYKPRKIAKDEPRKASNRPPNPAHEKLSTKCIRVVVENFGDRPVKEVIPPPQMAEITKLLPTDLSPLVGARYIYNESYWKRCCVDKYGWHNCHLHEHNLLWKQLFFEKLLQETLEDFDAVTEDPDIIYELIDAAMDYIFTLSFKQLPSHIELFEICDMLPNLTKLDITYGVKKIGMNYERMLFGMKISDATSLAKIFDHSDTLTTVILSGNMIDDDLLRMLMTGLIKNNTITHLDVSHNKITNHGARLLSKLLGENSVITTMNLSDNQIHAEGGRYLARGLRENDSLLQLNLRLNRLTDEGCSLLLEGLRDNVNLTELNIGSNGAGSQAAQILFSIVRDPEHNLQVLDISGNELVGEHFEQMRLSMAHNSCLTSLDMRRNPGYDLAPSAVAELEKIVHNNEYRARTAAGHP